MGKHLLAFTLALAGASLAPLTAAAQETRGSRDRFESRISLGEISPTPEMWFYDQALRRYENPQYAVRQKAEQRSDQRARRLAAQRWFGFSNARPNANPTPFFGTYSPTWASNTYDPYSWAGRTNSYVVLRPDRSAAGIPYGLW